MSIQLVSLKIAQTMVDDEDERDHPSAFQRSLPWLAGAAGLAGAGWLGYQALQGPAQAPESSPISHAIGTGLKNSFGGPSLVQSGVGGGLLGGGYRVLADRLAAKASTPENLRLSTLARAATRAGAGTPLPLLNRVGQGLGLADTSDREVLASRDGALSGKAKKPDGTMGDADPEAKSTAPRAPQPYLSGKGYQEVPASGPGVPPDIKGPEWAKKIEEHLHPLGQVFPKQYPPVTVQQAQVWADTHGHPDAAKSLQTMTDHFGVNAIKDRPIYRTVGRPLGAAAMGAGLGMGINQGASMLGDYLRGNE